jgi:hypothetical protein
MGRADRLLGRHRRHKSGVRFCRRNRRRAGPFSRLSSTRRLRRYWLLFAVQNLRPIELNLRVMIFDQADGLFVEGRSTDADTRWRPKPIKNSRTAPVPSPRTMDDVGVFVPTLVSCEAQRRQGLLPFLRSGRRSLRGG